MKTPAADALAAQGVCFEQAYCTSPVCSPSRGSMVTGRYPHANGLTGLAHLGWELGRAERTIQDLLGEAGYETALFGFQHERKSPYDLGYDFVFQTERAAFSDQLVEPFRDYLNTQSEPFYASVGFYDPHRINRTDGYPEDMYPPVDADELDLPGYLPTDPRVLREFGAFATAVSQMDESLGAILQAIDDSGKADDTLVVFATDHGIAFPGAKGELTDAGLEVALMMRWPGRIPAGRRVSSLASLLDLTPTVLDLLGLPALETMHGCSLRPLLAGEAEQVRSEVFAESNHDVTYRPIRCIRTEDFKLVRHFPPCPSPVALVDVCSSVAAEVIAEQGFVPHRDSVELYSLRDDPEERVNLAEDERFGKELADLSGRLDHWMRATADSLLVAPSGGSVG